MDVLDALVGMLLLPAALADSVFQVPVSFEGEPARINGRNFTLYRARSPAQWQRGFKGWDVGADEAMLFEFPAGGWKFFWMKGTRTPLDIVFLDGDFRVVKVVKGAQPCGLLCRPHVARARYVLEVRAGSAAEMGLRAGGSVELDAG